MNNPLRHIAWLVQQIAALFGLALVGAAYLVAKALFAVLDCADYWEGGS